MLFDENLSDVDKYERTKKKKEIFFRVCLLKKK